MLFLNRVAELTRLRELTAAKRGGLVVIHGRRRVGKTRLLLEWSQGARGLYAVGDQSAPAVQRRYLAEALQQIFPGFAEVEYPDWRGLLARLASAAAAAGWRGPLVLDELPYLVMSSPELPSVLQNWIDHAASAAKLVVAVAGSSQRMMQGLALSAEAPLYGRAREILKIAPLAPDCVTQIGINDAVAATEFYAAWGGVPRYWELAQDRGANTLANLVHLALDPLGALHGEPDRLLIEELPSAIELRPILDAIGAGAHRLSEIAGRMGRPVTSLSRAIQRLIELELVARDIPFGESEHTSKRSLYRIGDPFFRMWFRVVASQRSRLVGASAEVRLGLLKERWPALAAEAWEEICRAQIPMLGEQGRFGRGAWQAGQRWWHGQQPEWDIVSRSSTGAILLGEAKWSRNAVSLPEVRRLTHEVRSRRPPDLHGKDEQAPRSWAVFLPRTHASVPPVVDGVHVVNGRDVFGMG